MVEVIGLITWYDKFSSCVDNLCSIRYCQISSNVSARDTNYHKVHKLPAISAQSTYKLQMMAVKLHNQTICIAVVRHYMHINSIIVVFFEHMYISIHKTISRKKV